MRRGSLPGDASGDLAPGLVQADEPSPGQDSTMKGGEGAVPLDHDSSPLLLLHLNRECMVPGLSFLRKTC